MELKSVVDKIIFLLILYIVWIVISNTIEKRKFRIDLTFVHKYVKKALRFMYKLLFSKIENFEDDGDDDDEESYTNGLEDLSSNIKSHKDFYKFIKDVYQNQVKNTKNSNSSSDDEWEMWKNYKFRNGKQHFYKLGPESFYENRERIYDLNDLKNIDGYQVLKSGDKDKKITVTYKYDEDSFEIKNYDSDDENDQNQIKLNFDGKDLKYQIKDDDTGFGDVISLEYEEKELGQNSEQYFKEFIGTLVYEINDLNKQIAHLQKVTTLGSPLKENENLI